MSGVGGKGTRLLRTSSVGLIGALMLAIGLASCASVSDLASDVNPFKEKEALLPGERVPLFDSAAVIKVEDKSPVSIAGATGFTSWGQAGGPLSNNPPHASFGGQGIAVWNTKAAISGGDTDLRAAARPVSYGGRIAVYSPDGKVALFNASNGGRVWSSEVRPQTEKGAAVGGAVAMDGARVIAATGYSELLALEAGSGRRLWTFQLDAPARGAPVIVGDKVLAVSATNSLYAVNISDGTEAWVLQGIPKETGVLGSASPAVSGNLVLFASTSGELVAVDLKSGEMKWSDTVAQGSRRFAISGISAIAGGPVISDGVVYVASVSGAIVAFRMRDGERLWDRSLGSIHAPVVSGNTVFLLDLDDRMVALNRKSGKIRWSTQLPSVRSKKQITSWSGPVLAGGKLWSVSNEGKLNAVNPTDGQVTLTRDLKDPVYLSPIAVGGRLITLSGSGRLTAYK